MRSDDQNLIRYLFSDNRQIKVKLVFGTGRNPDTITSVQSLDIDTDFGNTIAIGNTVSTSVKVTCETPSFSLRDKEFTLYFGVILSGTTVTWTKMGKFKILPGDIENRLGFSTFTAYDKMYYKTKDIYYSTLSYPGPEDNPTKMNDVLAEIGRKSGLTVPDLTVGPFVNPAVPADYLTEYTLRDALGYIASYQGMNAYIDSDGDTVVFKWFTQSTYNVDGHYANVPYADEKDVVIEKLIASTGEENIQAGSGSDGLVFNNPLMTSERLEAMLPTFENFTYRRLDADIPVGNYLLEPWDILHISYIENPMAPESEQTTINYTAPAMSLSFHYDGGLSCKASSHGVPDSVMKSISARKFTDHTKFDGLQKEIVHATEQITGASGGYVRINFGDDGKTAEIMILDQPNPEDAENVWRWNQNGLGHSHNGYNGPFDDVALTADGHIVADRISGNEISGVNFRTISDSSRILISEGYINFLKGGSGDNRVGSLSRINSYDGREHISFLVMEDCAFDLRRNNSGGKPDTPEFIYTPGGAGHDLAKFEIPNGKLYILGYDDSGTSSGIYEVAGEIWQLKRRVKSLEDNLDGLFTIIQE